ncbi:hypothetical protein [Deinococcus sp. Marseille-Q6407]|uniref:hypothetical protein n=1 Tax=Deinococcus sp. Marseille-Q6407 TaxID=2969223 RepID=UPI0021C01E7F|nr:hypothetical protein [Deinococcus sp. Marseille-Q6407]
MTRTIRLLHPVDRTAPALPRLRLPTLAALLTLAAAVAQAFSAREDGHLRPAHWLLLAGLLAVPAYAPFVLHLLVPQLEVTVPFIKLPMLYAGGTWFFLMHAAATWAKQSGVAEA